VNFSVIATGTGNTYQWRKGTVNLVDGGNISGATSATLTINPMIITDVATNYNVVISGTCSPAVTSSDASLSLCGFIGITPPDADTANKTVTIYPNPFRTSINIILNGSIQSSKVEMKIYNVLGVEVINTTLTKKMTTLGMESLPSGIYLYKVIINSEIIQSGRLISQKN